MKRFLARVIPFVAPALLAFSPGWAGEAAPGKINTNWGRWGPDDELGTLNLITPEVVRHAATLVRKGKVISLALPLTDNQPIGLGRKVHRFMVHTGQGGDDPQHARQFTDDFLSMPVHGTTHWDGLPHYYYQGRLYNGIDVKTVTSYGAEKAGIEKALERVVTRGVLIDLLRDKGVSRLPSGYAITPEDLEGAARRQGVSFRTGDVILIRTGWLSIWYEGRAGREAFYKGEPGLGWAATQWLHKVQAAAVALDNRAVDVQPPEPPTMDRNGHPYQRRVAHYELLHNQGMLVGEMFVLDKLARDCAEDGVYEFMFVAQPLNLVGGTGSPLNPLAIK